MNNFRNQIVAIGVISIILFSSCKRHEEEYPTEINGIEFRDITIIGAGISGLTCGYHLNQRKKSFMILEKTNRVGGRAISGMKNNFTYAKGAEYLGKPESVLSGMIKGLGLSPKEIPSPMDAYYDGSNFYYGTKGIERYMIGLSNVSTYKRWVQLLLNEGNEYDDIPYIEYNNYAKELDNISAEQWLVQNGFSAYVNKYNVASRGLFGAALSEISALSLIPEAAFDFDEDDLADINGNFDINNEYGEAAAEESESYTFTKGLTELTDALGAAMSTKIRLSSNVYKISKDGDYYLTEYYDVNGVSRKLLSNKIVLAIPAPLALALGNEIISDERKALIEQIQFSSYATVALFSNTPIFNKAFDLAVPNNYFFTDLYDATWVQRHFDKSLSSDTYIISAYIAPQTYTDHAIDKMSDSELLENVYKDLVKIFPDAKNQITGHDIQHFPYAYPVMTLGAYERLIKLYNLNKGTVLLAGDSMIYPTFEAAVESGYQAARTLINKK
ncbi:MAG: flavin monoamine oxidase family protein [Marinifilaceae bacterium]